MTALGLPAPSDARSLVEFSEIRAARTVENALYLTALVLMGSHFLALTRALGATSPSASLFGGAVGVLGIVVLVCGALLHVATAALSELHSTAASEEKATVVLVWQGVQSVFDTLLVTGAILVPFGLITLGWAMRRSPLFGRTISWTAVGLGMVGLTGAAVALVHPDSPAVAASVLSLLAFHGGVGARSYRHPASTSSITR